MKKLISIFTVLLVLCFGFNAMADSTSSINGVSSSSSAGNNSPSSAAAAVENNSPSSAAIELDQSVHDNVHNYEATKGHPNTGIVPIPTQPGWFTTPTPDGDFISIQNIVQFGEIYSIGALKNMAKGGHTRLTYAEVNSTKAKSTRDKDDIEIMIVFKSEAIEAIKKTGTHIAFVNGSATNGKTNSVQLMAKMALKALKNGANVIAFQAEGAHRKVESFGWGLGFSYVTAGEDHMGTGGTGISGGSAGPEDWPWLQANAFVDAGIQDMINSLPSNISKAEKK